MVTAEVLRGTELFATLSEAQLQSVVGLCQEESHEPGETLFVEGAEARTIYILLEGTVTLRIQTPVGTEVMVYTVRNPGEVFGWSALVEPRRFTATARCLEKSRVIAIDGPALRALLEENKVIGYSVMRTLASVVSLRLRSTRSQLTGLLAKAPVTAG